MPPLHKLHPNLYNNSINDITMDIKKCSIGTQQSSKGVPGFPDFPDIWTGQSSAPQRQRKRSSPFKTPRHKKCITRKAVNTQYRSEQAVSSMTRALKVRAREERKLHRLEKCIKLKNRREQKRDMSNLCRGVSGMCK
eukprot:scaffold268942_cov89-Cyclotella_meneghiniana.AAC.1